MEFIDEWNALLWGFIPSFTFIIFAG